LGACLACAIIKADLYDYLYVDTKGRSTEQPF
jgi:hypothetical protein